MLNSNLTSATYSSWWFGMWVYVLCWGTSGWILNHGWWILLFSDSQDTGWIFRRNAWSTTGFPRWRRSDNEGPWQWRNWGGSQWRRSHPQWWSIGRWRFFPVLLLSTGWLDRRTLLEHALFYNTLLWRARRVDFWLRANEGTRMGLLCWKMWLGDLTLDWSILRLGNKIQHYPRGIGLLL